jgi:hypothetical protein
MKIKILATIALLIMLISCKKQETEKNEYYPDGKLWRKTVYSSVKDKDKNFHLYEFYENGIIKNLRNYENGIMQGKCLNYYDNGNIRSVFYYDKGKLNSTGRYYNENGKLTDKGLFINDSMVVKEEFIYNGNILQLNVFSKKNENFEQTGYLLYDYNGRFGLDNSFYYITSSLDSVRLGDSLKINLNFITHNTKGARLALSLGELDENLEFVGKDKTYLSDSLALAFYYTPTRIGYNQILGKLLYITGAPKKKVSEFIFYHDFLAY